MKQTIQLEIQFDGQALPMPTAAAAPSPVRSLSTDAAELRMLAAVRRAAAKAQAAFPSLTLAAQAAACVAFAFGFLFISAIIGG